MLYYILRVCEQIWCMFNGRKGLVGFSLTVSPRSCIPSRCSEKYLWSFKFYYSLNFQRTPKEYWWTNFCALFLIFSTEGSSFFGRWRLLKVVWKVGINNHHRNFLRICLISWNNNPSLIFTCSLKRNLHQLTTSPLWDRSNITFSTFSW